MNELKGKLVLQGWYNGKWNVIDHDDDDTSEGLARLEKRYDEPDFEGIEMRIEKFT